MIFTPWEENVLQVLHDMYGNEVDDEAEVEYLRECQMQQAVVAMERALENRALLSQDFELQKDMEV